MNDMNDRKQLRELCDKATQGDWWIDSHGHRMMSHENGDTIFVTFDKAMGPAIRNPETGNLSHWPNDWDASYIVAVQPKVVRGLLDEIERLNALVIERETVRIGQSLQRHDDQKQIDELVALGIQQDKDEIARLKAEIAALRDALADKVVDSTKLRSLVPEDGGFTIGVEGGAAALMADAFGEQLYTSDAINYLQMTFTSGAYQDLGQIVVTLQRCTGKTPHELRIDAERERDRWQHNYEHLIEQHMPRTGHGCEEGWSRVVEARELQAENEELRRDAERYRWLRESKNTEGPSMVSVYATGELDSAIDRMIAKEQP